jgi:ABC-type cobalamin/Fe3+-siderophores transport system ATPase subunit
MRVKKAAYVHGLITTYNKQRYVQQLSRENQKQEVICCLGVDGSSK